MTAFIVAYESKNPLSDEQVSGYIRNSGEAMQVTERLWILETEKEAKQLRDEMKPLVGAEGRVVVIKSGRTAAWSNIMGPNKWLVDHL
ncbi:hypothetical protein [Pseudomonas shahriarae]|uniref:hypothetical protein n=1 Tax=Pseudomonas shahriarae TaxID=2745512 RepID=UPI00249C1636|nr:hypothetical protein [Pseudomonas shahriarae]MDI3205408.1 hypothetical protein [Pseudomonas shahriarae]